MPERDEVACPDGVPHQGKIYQHHHFDSTRWDKITPRDDDIILAAPIKSGQTWTQAMLFHMLTCNGDKPVGPDGNVVGVHDASAWVDLRVVPAEKLFPMLEAQTNRRVLKTHLPADAMPFNKENKYLCVVRDVRDMFISWQNHYGKASPAWYGAMNETPGLNGPPIPHFSELGDVDAQFKLFLEKGSPGLAHETDGYPIWSVARHLRTWWECRKMPNLMFVHYAELLNDLEGQMRRMAHFLEIDVPEDKWPEVVKASTFTEMKGKADEYAPAKGAFWTGGSGDFINKGTNGRWIKALSPASLQLYEEWKVQKMSAGLNYYLEHADYDSACIIEGDAEDEEA